VPCSFCFVLFLVLISCLRWATARHVEVGQNRWTALRRNKGLALRCLIHSAAPTVFTLGS
jgi:hypothetical protein